MTIYDVKRSDLIATLLAEKQAGVIQYGPTPDSLSIWDLDALLQHLITTNGAPGEVVYVADVIGANFNFLPYWLAQYPGRFLVHWEA